MGKCQPYSTLLGLKTPWKIENADDVAMKKTVEVYVIHER